MPSTRNRILNAYEHVLLTQGERAATLDAVAEVADVSKGGLIYHFASKAALVEGLLGRLRVLLEHDLAHMRADPRRAVEHYLRTSVNDHEGVRTFLAAQSLVLAGDRAVATEVLHMGRAWLQALETHIGDPVLAKVVQLIGDGLSLENWLHLAARAADRTEAGSSTPAQASVTAEAAGLDAIINFLVDIVEQRTDRTAYRDAFGEH